MPRRTIRPGRVADSQIIELLEMVMTRWRTNHPLMAVGGFSYSRPSEEWLRALEGHATHFVTSAAISEKDAAFTLHFRRNRDGVSSDEIAFSWRSVEAADAAFGETDATALQAMLESLGSGVPALPGPA